MQQNYFYEVFCNIIRQCMIRYPLSPDFRFQYAD